VIAPLQKTASILTVLSMAALDPGVDLRVIGRLGGRVTAAVTLSLFFCSRSVCSSSNTSARSDRDQVSLPIASSTARYYGEPAARGFLDLDRTSDRPRASQLADSRFDAVYADDAVRFSPGSSAGNRRIESPH
jgi:hypothetical protein